MTSESHGTPSEQQFEVTIGVIVSASDVEEAMEIAEQSVGDGATVMTVQLADRSLLAPAKAREATILSGGTPSDERAEVSEARLAFLRDHVGHGGGIEGPEAYSLLTELLALRALSLTGSGGSPKLGWAYDGSALSPAPALKQTGSVVAWRWRVIGDNRWSVLDHEPAISDTFRDRCEVEPLVVASEPDQSLLDEMAKHVGWELDWGPATDGQEGEYAWRVYDRHGGVNDQVWDLLGTGNTPREALSRAALLASLNTSGDKL